MYRRNWIDRWDQLTGNRPDEKLHKPLSWNSNRTVREDAVKAESRKFIRRDQK